MRRKYLRSLSVEELWKLHEEVALELAQKLQSENTGARRFDA